MSSNSYNAPFNLTPTNALQHLSY